MFCPQCDSNATQAIKMMCLSATATGSSTVIGITTGLDIGVASVGSRSQSKLAAQFNPGLRPGDDRYGCLAPIALFPVLLAIGGFSVILDKPKDGVVLLALAAITTTVIALIKYKVDRFIDKEQEVWDNKKLVYEHGWICHKCGHSWLPLNN